MTIAPTVRITVRDLMRLAAQDQRVEVIDGEITPMTPVGFLHVMVAGNVYRALYEFATAHKLGYVCGDSLIYVLEQDEERGIRRTRIPDASFIRKERMPETFNLSDPFPGAPDLAVEVMSPDDSATDLLAKIRAYFRAGTEQVWVFYPEHEEIHQYFRDQPEARLYRGDERIEADTLFSGLRLIARDMFVLPDLSD
jgi:Uma2 family endonuclease